MSMHSLWIATFAGWLMAATVSRAAELPPSVAVVLRQHCLDCHGAEAAESRLRLDTPLAALRGGDSGELIVVPGASDRSYLIERVTNSNPDYRMPPDGEPLADGEVQALRDWIANTENWEHAREELAKEKSDHWSFQPLSRSRPPRGGPHPIDAFVGRRLADAGLEFSEAASRRRRIRRLFLVMHGLPPTPEQVEAFVADERPRAWEELVDQVLESPRYGERWATFWLDLVRFGETHGFETNRERPHAWRYRDWVIDAWNQDKPYDRFIIEQLAGDVDGEHAATGFLVAGPYDLVKGQDPLLGLMQRQDELADMINATGTAFLGLTLGCARCHNHKFDPVTQTDYYAMQAVFAGVNHADRALPPTRQTERELAALDRELAQLRQSLEPFVEGSDRRPPVNAEHNVETFDAIETRYVRFTIAATNSSQPCIDELEVYSAGKNVALASMGAKASSGGDFVHPLHKLEHINDGRYGNTRSWIAAQPSGGWVQLELPRSTSIDRIEWGRDREGKYRDRVATEYVIEVSTDGTHWESVASSDDRLPIDTDSDVQIRYDFDSFPPHVAARGREQLARLETLTERRAVLAESVMVYAGTFSQPGPTHRLYRGEPGSPREQVAPGAITSLSSLRLAADSPEQDRRRRIAEWIGDRSNPLTARVLVNRIWQHHFGSGLVDTPSDFGGNGGAPSHPQLLDWLALEFMEHDWSIKRLQRLILTSRTWQQDSRPRADALQIDAGNRFLWRFAPRRLEAEGIRDSILAVSGILDLRVGGPGFDGFEVEMENVRHYFPKQEYGPAEWRRMIYMTRVRQEKDAVFGVFDCPDYSQVVPARNRSTTPLQSLNLLNSHFVMQQAGFLVDRLSSDAASHTERVERAYALCFARPPSDDETQAALDFIVATDWLQFARAMLNANEFVFIP